MTTPGRLFEVDPAQDVRTVTAFAENLTPYIYDDALYGHLADASLPRLTLGGLLMRLHRLEALPALISPAQQEAVAAAAKRLAAVRAEWPVALEKKITQELKARLNALEVFLAEAGQNPRLGADNYPSTMEKRVMIVHLQREAEAAKLWTDTMKGHLLVLDNGLRRLCEAGGFCWTPRVAPAYPQDDFWFLYARVKITK